MSEMGREEMNKLVDVVAAGVRVLQTRDGVKISEDQIRERANNIVGALVGLYEIHEIVDD